MTAQSLLAIQIVLALIVAVGVPIYCMKVLEDIGNEERTNVDRAAEQCSLLDLADISAARRHVAQMEFCALVARDVSEQRGKQE